MNAKSVVLVPYGSDPLATLAALMLERHQRELPDLSAHVALLPSASAIVPFREALLAAAAAAGHGGVLAPWCGTLDAWLESQADDTVGPLEEPERELLLLDALADFSVLRERYGTWPLIDALLALFDELNGEYPELPADAAELAVRLAAGYGAAVPPPPLQEEARLVHTLWNAWNTHLASRGRRDRGQRRRAALARSAAVSGGSYHIYVAGPVALTRAEAQWLNALLRDGRATVVLHGQARAAERHPDAAVYRCLEALAVPPPAAADPTDAYTRFLDAVYADRTDLGTRAREFAAAVPVSPLAGRLCVHPAADFEQEARAVDLAVRRWRARGRARIGVVALDRKLARRVRALLERANIALHDSAGWALSTTSAATAVARWLECVEHDFPQAPLLDFLKSPFVTLDLPRAQLDALAHIFEERVVRARNIGGGLARYRRALDRHSPTDASAGAGPPPPDAAAHAADDDRALAAMLDRLAAAAAPLQRLLGGRPRTPVAYLRALETSLARTGMLENLAADAAGAPLLAALRPRQALAALGARVGWHEFLQWLQRELERRRFRPPSAPSGVELLDLAATRCLRFDALVIAGCTREHLPGSLFTSPFFNDAVRANLGLPTREARVLAPLHDFRRLLEAAPEVLLTWRRQENGEAVVPSPWTERLVAFHRLAYGAAPHDPELHQLLATQETNLYRREAVPLPPPAAPPAPRLPRERLPAAVSAAAHQRLLDCPYQFYAADGLGLRALDDVRDELEKSDYGKYVHRVLHAFHGGVSGLPGPWRGSVTPANRREAEALLLDIGRRVFAFDSDRRFSTRGWRHRFEALVAAYLDWQERRGTEWTVEATERTLTRDLPVGERAVALKGRADRIDRGAAGRAIVDYKTGLVPDAAAVLHGESAQLPFYALLHPGEVSEVVYVQLRPEGVRTLSLSGADLAHLAAATERRLAALLARIDAGAPLPAWGDPETCKFCRYEGLCRKEMWDTTGDA